jgi:hypothetical protein
MRHETFTARYVIGYLHLLVSSFSNFSSFLLILLRSYFSNFSSLSVLSTLTGTSAHNKNRPYMIAFSLQDWGDLLYCGKPQVFTIYCHKWFWELKEECHRDDGMLMVCCFLHAIYK